MNTVYNNHRETNNETRFPFFALGTTVIKYDYLYITNSALGLSFVCLKVLFRTIAKQ